MALGRQQMAGRRNQNSVSFRPRDTRLGPVSNTIILIVLGCLLGLLYLTQVTKTNAYGYAINSMEEQKTSLTTEQNDLHVTSARLQSIERVQNSAQAKSMVAAAPTDVVR